MSKYPLNVRVLDHEEGSDQIRIGAMFVTWDIEKTVKDTIAAYDKQAQWCGGYNEAYLREYHHRIAIVDAETLQSVREIWNKEELFGTKKA